LVLFESLLLTTWPTSSDRLFTEAGKRHCIFSDCITL